MISAVSAATMTSAVVAIQRLVELFAASDSLTTRAFLWRGEKHLPQREGRNCDEHQQQHANMHPTGRVHSGVLPRLGCRILSTERM